MEKRPRPAELLSTLLRQNRYDRQELDHLFRLLSKRSHPDATGGNGEDFIELRRIYERACARLGAAPLNDPSPVEVRSSTVDEEVFSSSSQGPSGIRTSSSSWSSPPGLSRGTGTKSGFDPSRIVREAGFDESLSSRGCLFLSLRAFFNLGMYNHRIRSLRGLQRRNAEILYTILYWGKIYSPRFVPVFTDYSSRTFQSLSTTWEIKNFNYAKRLFLDGVTGFFNYQVSGRTGTAEVARDKFTWCSYTLRKVIKDSHPMAPMAEWFLEELDSPPELRN